MKKDKLVGLSDKTKRLLSIQAAKNGTSLKKYCEDVLENHAFGEERLTDPVKEEDVLPKKPLTDDDTIIDMQPGSLTVTKKKKPVKVGNTTLMPLDEFNDTTLQKDPSLEDNLLDKPELPKDETPKSDSIPAKDKKGKFERIEPNIYTNGTVFECRRMVKDKGLTSDFFRTIEEAREAKSKK